jgi:putative drug exporter of the RND superfamily
MTKLTRFTLSHKRLVAGFWILLTLLGVAFAGKATNAMKQTFSVPDREGSRTNQLVKRAFHGGGDQAPILPVVTLPRGTSVESPKVTADLNAIAARAERAAPGTRVASYATTHSEAFVSDDGRTTYLLAYTPPGRSAFGGGNKQAAKAIERALRGTTVAGAPVHVTGLDVLADDKGGGGTGVLLEAVLGALGALAVLAFVFASLLAFVPLIVAICSIMTSFLMVWGLTAFTDISPIVSFLIALIGLGVAIDYSLLIVVRWREERARGSGDDEAIVRAMASAGRTVVFSGTTVAIGLLAMIALPLPFLRSVGYGGMLIPLVSVIVTITLLPVILSKFGRRLDWPHKRSEGRASRAWTRWAQIVVRRRWAAATVAVALLAGLVIGATTLNLGAGYGNPDITAKRGDAKAGLKALERAGIGSGALTPIEVLVREGNATTVAARTATVDGVHGAAATGWRNATGSLVEVIPTRDASTSTGRHTLDDVRDVAHASGRDVNVGGIGAGQQDFVDAVYSNFPLMVALIGVVTLILLARAFRSIVLPLKAMLLNMISVAAAWGVVALIWQHGYGSDAIWGIAATGSVPSWIPLMVFAFLFGLSMDYEVFILARMREEYDATGSTDQAVVRGIGRTGRLVTSAALILFLSFASMGSAPDANVKMLATGLAAGIIVDATVIRALLVPAVVSLMGRWNWWLPAPVARVLRVQPAAV